MSAVPFALDGFDMLPLISSSERQRDAYRRGSGTASWGVERCHFEWIDRFLGSDPGFNRLRSALMGVLTIAVVLEVELLFVRLTHALQQQTNGVKLPPGTATAIAQANHEYLIVMMLLGAIAGMMAGSALSTRRRRVS